MKGSTSASGSIRSAWPRSCSSIVIRARAISIRPPWPTPSAALRTVRARAAEFNVDPARIGILGFSAGGHLASSAGTHFDAGKSDSTDAIEPRQLSTRFSRFFAIP